ncbi:MarR family winged helix-turn-helix transcriptional regulator [Actinacidiphila paucisporea]|uniref:Transcriptional regulator, MarR family n=1 Tax=Actinacidiphila paucisporea TaxID=310782 RepID=A0A1M7HYB6_9ACTN|nr:MarR family transcriptional regulator [Actinacidiphila paucisporea]SHM33541.1 transcriptional regulator, MarR family [Actinacidiphila paucisporea]
MAASSTDPEPDPRTDTDTDPADAPPADSGPARIAADLRAAIGPLVRRLRQFRPDEELTLSQTSALVRLDREGPATGSELAAGEGVRPQSMAAILAVLYERGLVSRDPDPADGRRIVVSLSAAGREGLRGARREKGLRLTRAIADELTPEEQAVLAAALPLLERITRRV